MDEVREIIKLAHETDIVYTCADNMPCQGLERRCNECDNQILVFNTKDIALAIAHSIKNNIPTWISKNE